MRHFLILAFFAALTIGGYGTAFAHARCGLHERHHAMQRALASRCVDAALAVRAGAPLPAPSPARVARHRRHDRNLSDHVATLCAAAARERTR